MFAIAAIAEGVYPERAASDPTDLYGRRNHRSHGLLGTFSAYTNVTATLLYDFDFGWFDANKTLNHSAASQSQSNGPTGLFGAEGHYGLIVVGSAHVQNCNSSSTCCDGYNASIGLGSCKSGPSVCAVLQDRRLEYNYVINSLSRRQVPSNMVYPDGGLPEVVILSLQELRNSRSAPLPSNPCGPSLRLTPSEARQSGSIWYPRKVNVREGFDTTFTFEISNPSQHCDRLADVNTFCRSRGK